MKNTEKLEDDLNVRSRTNLQSDNSSIQPKPKAVYLLLDSEATGFFPHKNGLIEVAALALDQKLQEVARFQTYIKPPSEVIIDAEAMEINNISTETIASGRSYQQFCETFIEFIHANFESKPIIVAQFYPFDASYLSYVFEYCGYEDYHTKVVGNDFVDTKSLVNFVNMQDRLHDRKVRFEVTSLSKPGGLKEVLNISSNEYEAHSAMGDVLATYEVLKALISTL
jgi:DNA polymerase III epsilon subunit-like protein